jgi:PAS domain S-box-containing protein
MKDADKAKAQLIEELKDLGQKIAKLRNYERIVETTHNPIGLVDRNYVYQYVNRSYCDAFKKKQNEIIDHYVVDLFGQEIFDKILQPHYERCFAGEDVSFQNWFEFPGWGRRYMDVRYYPLREADGRVGAVVTNVHDITESKRADQALAEQLDFERLIANIAANLAHTKPEQLDVSIDSTLQDLGRFLRSERSFHAQFTSDGKSLFHRNIWAAEGLEIPPYLFEMDIADESPWLAQQLRLGKVINTGPGLVDLPEEAGNLRDILEKNGIKSGVVVPVRVEGNTIGMLGLDTIDQPCEYPPAIVDRLKILADMIGSLLQRVQIQARLQESEQRFRAFMENIPASIYIKDENDFHLYGNKAAIKSVGVKQEEFIGSTTRDFWPSRLAEKLIDLDRKVLEEDIPSITEEWQNIERGDNCWRRDIKFPIKLDSGKKLLGGIALDITDIKLNEQKLQAAYREIKQLQQKLEQENIYLREEIELQHRHIEIIGNSQPVKQMLGQAEQVAGTDSTVLILGETGTGKELLARAIHRLSSRSHHPMVTVNCAALPASLIESEMFGREKGAFTGALSSRIGRFEVADGSTIFLDEIGELTPDVQMKLLRVLEKGQFERLGSSKTIKVDVRIIAATNRDLVKAVHDGSFRRDLFYRLNVFPISVPALHDRIEDLELLIWAFVKEFGERMGKRIETISKKSIEALKRCPWKGNIRELRNVIEQSMIITKGPTLNVKLPGIREQSDAQSTLLNDVERNHMIKILKLTGWRGRGKQGAAELLGLKPTTLDARMKKRGILRPK